MLDCADPTLRVPAMAAETPQAPYPVMATDWSFRLGAEPKNVALYHAYLASPEWAERRKMALEAAGHACRLCPSTNDLQVHHRTYDRVGAEHPSDLTVLCRRCHKHFHGAKRKPRKQRKQRQRSRAASHAPAGSEPTLTQLHDIITLNLEPGQKFTTEQLADAYGFSRARVGSRLSKLAEAGEIDRLAKRRWQRPPTPNQFLREVYALADKWGANVKESASR